MCFGQLFLSPKAAVKTHWASFWAATWAFLFSLLGLSYSIHDLMIEETLLRVQILYHVTWTIFLGRINVLDEAGNIIIILKSFKMAIGDNSVFIKA